MAVHTLIRLDNRTIRDEHNEIRAFMTLRDEMLRLPGTLDHYRQIGVGRFFTIDNGSTDGTREFLLEQPDCHVFVTHDSYSEAGYGLQWQQALLNQYGVNHWCLTVDADEWFIYPGYEDKPLTDLVAYLVRSDAQGMFAFLLDMYGRATLTEGEIATQRSLLDSCPYFDGEYVWRQRPRIPVVQGPRFPEYNITGGPRWRVLFPLAHRHYHLMWWVWHLSSYLKVPLPASLKSVPTLTKIPFVRWLPGTRYQHPHATTPIRLSRVTGVLLHFKFLADFHDRVATEVIRKEHWQAASEYVRYQAKLKNGNLWSAFHYSGSVAYKSSDQLVRLGLMKEDREWTQLRHASSTIVTQ